MDSYIKFLKNNKPIESGSDFTSPGFLISSEEIKYDTDPSRPSSSLTSKELYKELEILKDATRKNNIVPISFSEKIRGILKNTHRLRDYYKFYEMYHVALDLTENNNNTPRSFSFIGPFTVIPKNELVLLNNNNPDTVIDNENPEVLFIDFDHEELDMYQEQFSLKTILSNLKIVLDHFDSSKMVFFKLLDSHTSITAEIITILAKLYDRAILYKPRVSALNEKYLICMKQSVHSDQTSDQTSDLYVNGVFEGPLTINPQADLSQKPVIEQIKSIVSNNEKDSKKILKSFGIEKDTKILESIKEFNDYLDRYQINQLKLLNSMNNNFDNLSRVESNLNKKASNFCIAFQLLDNNNNSNNNDHDHINTDENEPCIICGKWVNVVV
jgi:hypothetical protein